MAPRVERFQTFPRDLKLATASLEPDHINRELAKLARRSLADAIAAREASSVYTKYVNTRGGSMVEGAAEESVEAPGPILYVFSYWEPIIAFARAELLRNSPRKEGDYINSQTLMIGGQVIDWKAEVAADEEVAIVATVPYSRKIEVGHMKTSVPDQVFQRVRRKIQSQFGLVVNVAFQMIPLPGGYTLKGRFRKGYKPFARKGLRRDTQAGTPMTYPAIIMSMKGY